MKINRRDCKIETMRGTGPGGQHRNKTDSAVRITHLPTGIIAYADERSQKHSKRKAWKILLTRIEEAQQTQKAQQKKARRNHAIHNTPIIRTYHYPRQTVTDHRTKKTAQLKDVLYKGRFDLIAPKEAK